ncbi:transmembrane protein, putative [Trichomonas vaginalis G3]|uniref:Transmembrane protein, putative n=1 Tax=Trichomonas vaginalis (strain ATCC PRA-98 / G3) TaxID=412133 RepID=A2EGG8_TRIV3|nr:hypothetical protein TVAGG3_0675570 [Trichomonas vaginalis G3]EAY08251.1 transmembrane protein, putative [Trichomonas vaginalis G3]KAI5507511.1 hypothetical protein TVAGG3_0675570 [Trichomonas vaginalis G3]|eukprot:XP_001320474.1 transmembrane protein [Trichomonas vaginalis G3]
MDSINDATTLKTAAQVKVNARLIPAKDLHTSYAEILSNADPTKFEDLKKQLLLVIDTAEAEYSLLNQEVSILNSMIPQWNNEITAANSQIDKLKEEITVLEKEKQDVDEKLAKYNELMKLKEETSNIHTDKLIKDIENCELKNKEDETNIEMAEKSNERRKQAVLGIHKNIQLFLGKNTDEQASPTQ